MATRHEESAEVLFHFLQPFFAHYNDAFADVIVHLIQQKLKEEHLATLAEVAVAEPKILTEKKYPLSSQGPGLTFCAALDHMINNDGKVCRGIGSAEYIFYNKFDGKFFRKNLHISEYDGRPNLPHAYHFTTQDILANDWEIVLK